MMQPMRQINRRNQITLPPKAMEAAGIRPGEYVEVSTEKGVLILRPLAFAERSLPADDWNKLERLVKRELRKGRVKTYDNVTAARKHLESIAE